MDKKFNSVSDLLKDIGIDKDIVKRVDKEIEDLSLGKKLTILRIKNDLSQTETAKKWECRNPAFPGLNTQAMTKLNLAI